MPSLVEALELKYGDVINHIENKQNDKKSCKKNCKQSDKKRDKPSTKDDQKATTKKHCADDESIQIAIFVPKVPPRVYIPSLLILNDCDITSAGKKEDLTNKCSCVEELDLAKNKLNHWSEVFTILIQMPRLRFLNLSFNQLSTPLENPANNSFTWKYLQNLVLNSTLINWDSVRKLLNWFPALKELHLSRNHYESVQLNVDECRNCIEPCANCQKHFGIRTLYFNGNLIRQWIEVKKLGIVFPSLENLVLADCPIETLNEEFVEKKTENNENNSNKEFAHSFFKNLRILNLNSTLLSKWDDIEALTRFPALQNTRVQGWPLWDTQEHTEHERRQLLIARLPNITILNGGGPITDEEREDSERAFIRYYIEKPESERPERYWELVNVHGKLDPLVSIDLRPEKRVKVTFSCGSNHEIRSVDVYRTVSDLKTKLENFSGIAATQMRLFYVDQDLRDMQGPEEMKYPNKQLYSYNIRSGDEIIIDLKKKR